MSSNSPLTVTAAAVELNKVPYHTTTPEVESHLWYTPEAVKHDNWNLARPYRLMVVTAEANGDYKLVPEWDYILPVAPESLSISTPFATTLSATLGGVAEESNGIVFRNFSISGTTGVLPLRPNAKTSATNPREGGGVADFFSGIVAGSVSTTVGAVAAASSYASGKPVNAPNLVEENDLVKQTGYYQFKLLERMLESYAAIKRTKRGKRYRLVFGMYKDDQFYLVTPLSFEVRRTVDSPLEYKYSIALKGWKRIKDPSTNYFGSSTQSFDPASFDAPRYKEILNKIQKARLEVQAGAHVLESVVQGSSVAILDILRESVVFVKGTVGATITLADLPKNIVNQVGTAIASALRAGSVTLDGIANSSSISDEAEAAWEKIKAALDTYGDPDTTEEKLPTHSLGERWSAATLTQIIGAPEAFSMREALLPAGLPLDANTLRSISAYKSNISNMTAADFNVQLSKAQQTLLDYCEAIGLGSGSYDLLYNRTAVKSVTREPTQEEVALSFALSELVSSLNSLVLATSTKNNQAKSLDYIAGLARKSGIAFTVPTHKVAVPFPHGHTLERVAAMYLTDPNRWHEIVALNGLRAPYVDEEGFEVPLLTDGKGNRVVVSDITNLFVGQAVTIYSNFVAVDKRRIAGIDKVSDSVYLVTLDGDSDLTKFTIMDKARLHAFLPDTVNSQQAIYIPSDTQTPTPLGTIEVPGNDSFDRLIEAGGTDLLLTQSGDIALTPDGDCRLAVGLTNIVQRVRLAVGTPRGTLLQHPSFGLGLEPGVSVADLNSKQLLAAAEGMFSDDPSFRGVERASVRINGPTVELGLSISLAGLSASVPVLVTTVR